MVHVNVTLRRNDTGAEVSYQLPVMREDDGTPSVFIFEDGNWSCDCNRILDWERHGGDVEGLPEDTVGTCLGGWEGVGLFSLRAVHDGEEIFADGWFALLSWVNGNGVQAVVQWVRDLRLAADVVCALGPYAREEVEHGRR